MLNIPLPGTIPTKVILPYAAASSPAEFTIFSTGNDEVIIEPEQTPSLTEPLTSTLFNFTFEPPPFPWARTEPYIYVQQIVLRSQVIPWKSDMLLTDAFRATLHEIFKLLEIVRNHEDEAR